MSLKKFSNIVTFVPKPKLRLLKELSHGIHTNRKCYLETKNLKDFRIVKRKYGELILKPTNEKKTRIILVSDLLNSIPVPRPTKFLLPKAHKPNPSRVNGCGLASKASIFKSCQPYKNLLTSNDLVLPKIRARSMTTKSTSPSDCNGKEECNEFSYTPDLSNVNDFLLSACDESSPELFHEGGCYKLVTLDDDNLIDMSAENDKEDYLLLMNSENDANLYKVSSKGTLENNQEYLVLEECYQILKSDDIKEVNKYLENKQNKQNDLITKPVEKRIKVEILDTASLEAGELNGFNGQAKESLDSKVKKLVDNRIEKKENKIEESKGDNKMILNNQEEESSQTNVYKESKKVLPHNSKVNNEEKRSQLNIEVKRYSEKTLTEDCNSQQKTCSENSKIESKPSPDSKESANNLDTNVKPITNTPANNILLNLKRLLNEDKGIKSDISTQKLQTEEASSSQASASEAVQQESPKVVKATGPALKYKPRINYKCVSKFERLRNARKHNTLSVTDRLNLMLNRSNPDAKQKLSLTGHPTSSKRQSTKSTKKRSERNPDKNMKTNAKTRSKSLNSLMLSSKKEVLNISKAQSSTKVPKKHVERSLITTQTTNDNKKLFEMPQNTFKIGREKRIQEDMTQRGIHDRVRDIVGLSKPLSISADTTNSQFEKRVIESNNESKEIIKTDTNHETLKQPSFTEESNARDQVEDVAELAKPLELAINIADGQHEKRVMDSKRKPNLKFKLKINSEEKISNTKELGDVSKAEEQAEEFANKLSLMDSQSKPEVILRIDSQEDTANEKCFTEVSGSSDNVRDVAKISTPLEIPNETADSQIQNSLPESKDEPEEPLRNDAKEGISIQKYFRKVSEESMKCTSLKEGEQSTNSEELKLVGNSACESPKLDKCSNHCNTKYESQCENDGQTLDTLPTLPTNNRSHDYNKFEQLNGFLLQGNKSNNKIHKPHKNDLNLNPDMSSSILGGHAHCSLIKYTPPQRALCVYSKSPELKTEDEEFEEVEVTPDEVAPKVTPKVEAKVEPEFPSKVTQKDASEAAPKAVRKVAPKVETKVASKLESKGASKVAPKVAPKVAQKVETKVASKLESKGAPKAASKVTSNVTSKVASKVAHKVESTVSLKVKPKPQVSAEPSQSEATVRMLDIMNNVKKVNKNKNDSETDEIMRQCKIYESKFNERAARRAQCPTSSAYKLPLDSTNTKFNRNNTNWPKTVMKTVFPRPQSEQQFPDAENNSTKTLKKTSELRLNILKTNISSKTLKSKSQTELNSQPKKHRGHSTPVRIEKSISTVRNKQDLSKLTAEKETKNSKMTIHRLPATRRSKNKNKKEPLKKIPVRQLRTTTTKRNTIVEFTQKSSKPESESNELKTQQSKLQISKPITKNDNTDSTERLNRIMNTQRDQPSEPTMSHVASIDQNEQKASAGGSPSKKREIQKFIDAKQAMKEPLKKLQPKPFKINLPAILRPRLNTQENFKPEIVDQVAESKSLTVYAQKQAEVEIKPSNKSVQHQIEAEKEKPKERLSTPTVKASELPEQNDVITQMEISLAPYQKQCEPQLPPKPEISPVPVSLESVKSLTDLSIKPSPIPIKKEVKSTYEEQAKSSEVTSRLNKFLKMDASLTHSLGVRDSNPQLQQIKHLIVSNAKRENHTQQSRQLRSTQQLPKKQATVPRKRVFKRDIGVEKNPVQSVVNVTVKKEVSNEKISFRPKVLSKIEKEPKAKQVEPIRPSRREAVLKPNPEKQKYEEYRVPKSHKEPDMLPQINRKPAVIKSKLLIRELTKHMQSDTKEKQIKKNVQAFLQDPTASSAFTLEHSPRTDSFITPEISPRKSGNVTHLHKNGVLLENKLIKVKNQNAKYSTESAWAGNIKKFHKFNKSKQKVGLHNALSEQNFLPIETGLRPLPKPIGNLCAKFRACAAPTRKFSLKKRRYFKRCLINPMVLKNANSKTNFLEESFTPLKRNKPNTTFVNDNLLEMLIRSEKDSVANFTPKQRKRGIITRTDFNFNSLNSLKNVYKRT